MDGLALEDPLEDGERDLLLLAEELALALLLADDELELLGDKDDDGLREEDGEIDADGEREELGDSDLLALALLEADER